MSGTDPDHLPEIDRLKGLAIIGVVCIHAKLGEGSLFYEHVINRAVPVFLVLFGVTSELWWQRKDRQGGAHPARSFMLGRFPRLLFPFWVMAAAWWLAVEWSGRVPSLLRLGWTDVAITFTGYAPWIGTGWFVTLILELVVLFPLLRWAAVRAPWWATLPAVAALCAACTWYTWDIVNSGLALFGDKVPQPGWFYAWIFPPRSFYPVVAGILLARAAGARFARLATLTGLGIALGGVAVIEIMSRTDDNLILGPLRRQVALYLFDVPLAAGLLGLLRLAPLPSPLARPLEWCGRASWGLYLGHLLVHEVLYMVNVIPETGPGAVRAVYALFLLGCGAALAGGGAALLGAARKVASRLAGSPARQ